MKLIRGPNGNIWGELDERIKVYYTTRAKEHFSFVYNGYGIQASIIDMLEKEGVTTIVIRSPTGNLISSTDLWRRRGKKGTLRHSDGEQIFLPLSEFGQNVERVRKLEDFR